MINFDGFELKRLIIDSLAGLAVSLVIGIVLFWLTLGTVQFYDAGVYSTGLTEISFVVGVLVASALFGSMKKDIISAGILGLIIGLFTSLFEGLVLSFFFSPMAVQFVMDWWGNPTVILIFVGVLAGIGSNIIFSRKNQIAQAI